MLLTEQEKKDILSKYSNDPMGLFRYSVIKTNS